jgi:hypothetical protein
MGGSFERITVALLETTLFGSAYGFCLGRCIDELSTCTRDGVSGHLMILRALEYWEYPHLHCTSRLLYNDDSPRSKTHSNKGCHRCLTEKPFIRLGAFPPSPSPDHVKVRDENKNAELVHTYDMGTFIKLENKPIGCCLLRLAVEPAISKRLGPFVRPFHSSPTPAGWARWEGICCNIQRVPGRRRCASGRGTSELTSIVSVAESLPIITAKNAPAGSYLTTSRLSESYVERSVP